MDMKFFEGGGGCRGGEELCVSSSCTLRSRNMINPGDEGFWEDSMTWFMRRLS